jgi:hypothetical protein
VTVATYAIAHQITYISRRGSEIYHVTCDYRLFKSNPEGGTDAVPLVVRKISDFSQIRDEAGFVALCTALGLNPKDLTNGKYDTWTICLLEALKPKAADIKLGRLNWVIRTALPLRVDFKVYLNSSEVVSAKEDIATVVSFAPGDIATNRINAMNERWGNDPLFRKVPLFSDFEIGVGAGRDETYASRPLHVLESLLKKALNLGFGQGGGFQHVEHLEHARA